MGHLLRTFIFARLSVLGCLAISSSDDRNRLEILPTAASRILRHEERQKQPSSLIQSASTPLELDPQVMGDIQSTTEIVQSGAGPTTTAIYAYGQGPAAGPAPNAIDLTPAPPSYYEPGPPGIPGPPGPPGPPGDPGPAEGYIYEPANETNHTGPLLTSEAGAGNTTSNATYQNLGVHTQSGYEIRGPQGAKGSKGLPGDKGDIGSQGFEGTMGDRGTTGPPGPRGARGKTGKSQHVDAPPKTWLYYAFAANGAFAILVLIVSYLEFVSNVHPFRYCFGGECCSEKCGGCGESFNGCCHSLTCGCCCRPRKKSMESDNWEGEGYGENYGGYEQKG